MFRAAAVLVALQLMGAGKLHAQSRQLSLEVNPFHATLGYGFSDGGSRVMGLDAGFGFPQLDRTLAPSGDDLIDILHLGAFVRSLPTRSIVVSGRVQVGLAELRGCSGCLPGLLTAVSGAAFWGGKRFKVGPRVRAGVIREGSAPATFVLSLTPLAALLTF